MCKKFQKVCVTNRHLCNGDFLKQIEKIAKTNEYVIILREKDLNADEYKKLAKEVLSICEKYDVTCILHYFFDVAKELDYNKIHVPLWMLRENKNITDDFDVVGVSVHSVEEAITAQALGASYITAGHIFTTDCKKGVPPRGLKFLQDVCSTVDIPVYAIGGISSENIELIKNIADGACQMSELMRI